MDHRVSFQETETIAVDEDRVAGLIQRTGYMCSNQCPVPPQLSTQQYLSFLDLECIT